MGKPSLETLLEHSEVEIFGLLCARKSQARVSVTKTLGSCSNRRHWQVLKEAMRGKSLKCFGFASSVQRQGRECTFRSFPLYLGSFQGADSDCGEFQRLAKVRGSSTHSRSSTKPETYSTTLKNTNFKSQIAACRRVAGCQQRGPTASRGALEFRLRILLVFEEWVRLVSGLEGTIERVLESRRTRGLESALENDTIRVRNRRFLETRP